MPVQHLLVPIDFSQRCQGATRYAEALGKIFDCTITLLHVLTPPHYEVGAIEVGGAVLEDLFRNRNEEAKAQLAAFLKDELPPERAERLLVEGDPAGQIIQLAHERESSLVVMPTHGYGTFRRFILGSVTAKVLHDADCPVWTGVHLEAESPEEIKFKTVTAAIDLGPQSERTLMWAARFAEKNKARLHIAHAGPSLEGRAGEYFDPEWQSNMEAAILDELGDLQRRVDQRAEVHIAHGETAHTVCRLAEAVSSDLLVIGRGSAAGVFGRMRANAYSIIRQSKCPVVSV